MAYKAAFLMIELLTCRAKGFKLSLSLFHLFPSDENEINQFWIYCTNLSKENEQAIRKLRANLLFSGNQLKWNT